MEHNVMIKDHTVSTSHLECSLTASSTLSPAYVYTNVHVDFQPQINFVMCTLMHGAKIYINPYMFMP